MFCLMFFNSHCKNTMVLLAIAFPFISMLGCLMQPCIELSKLLATFECPLWQKMVDIFLIPKMLRLHLIVSVCDFGLYFLSLIFSHVFVICKSIMKG